MKIEAQNIAHAKSIIISTPLFLKGLQKGMELPAHIIDRPGDKEAILEIKGQKIRASFLKGVPGNNRLTLKLEGIQNNSYIFKLLNTTDKSGFPDKILAFTLFSKDSVPDAMQFELHKLIQNNNTGLFELNALLFKKLFNTDKEENKGITTFLNKLLARGVPLQSLDVLAFILSGTKIDPRIYAILSFLTKKNAHLQTDENKIEDIIHKLFNNVDNKDIGENLLKQLTDFLTVNAPDLQNGHMGELPLLDEEGFIPVRYIASDKAWMFYLDLSHIGAVDILIKQQNNISASLFVENDEIKAAFEASIEKLFVQIKDILSHIHIFVRQQAINKMIEINSYYAINSAIDIKI